MSLHDLTLMELFDCPADRNKNCLPYDGCVHYFGKIFEEEKSVHYYRRLLDSISWRFDEAVIFGKKITTKRKVAWYGDQNYAYTYSNSTKHALPFTQELRELRKLVEELSREQYNSCLLNLYHDGSEGMAWHSDGEKDLKKDGAIASLSFGAERKFSFKHRKTCEKIDLHLENGSLLIMKDKTQTYWLHRLPPSKKIQTPRINLTFRFINS